MKRSETYVGQIVQEVRTEGRSGNRAPGWSTYKIVDNGKWKRSPYHGSSVMQATKGQGIKVTPCNVDGEVTNPDWEKVVMLNQIEPIEVVALLSQRRKAVRDYEEKSYQRRQEVRQDIQTALESIGVSTYLQASGSAYLVSETVLIQILAKAGVTVAERPRPEYPNFTN